MAANNKIVVKDGVELAAAAAAAGAVSTIVCPGLLETGVVAPPSAAVAVVVRVGVCVGLLSEEFPLPNTISVAASSNGSVSAPDELARDASMSNRANFAF